MAAFSLLLGFGLGLSLAAPPGPVNALIAREASRHGMAGGVRAGIPAPIVDSAYMCVVLFGLPRLFDIEAAMPWLAAVGALLMAYLCWDTVRHRSGGRELAGPWAVWAVTLSNPFQYAWWLTAGTAFLAQQGIWGVGGFLLAIFGWVVVFSGLVAQGSRRWESFEPLVAVASADLLLAFGLLLGFQAAAGL
jgi:threonine/homoserine/homoserine lactone efflux protein